MKISERIFELMKAKRITQAELAEALGITQPSVGNWKTRGTTPPMEYLPTICKVLGVSWEYLITGAETETHFTSDEIHIIEQFRKVPPEGQNDIKKFIEYQIYKNEDR